MNRENSNNLNNLRLRQSIEDFKGDFISLLQEDEKKAIGYLNETSVGFPTLFLLIPAIEAYELTSKLSWRNRLALNICRSIQKDKQVEKINKLSSDKNIIQVLQWMFETGSLEDGLNDDFDQVLDSVISLLIINFRDHNILPNVADMIFIRNQKGLYLHDLVWSFFESKNPITLQLVANHLQSNNLEDVELAHKLLHFEPSELHVQNIHPKIHHKAYKRWLDENDPYLYFTGESFQLTSDPIPCKVNIDAKYLNKRVSPHSGKPNKPLTRTEIGYLQEFQQLEIEDKVMLSKYSCKIYRDNIHTWKKWINHDIDNQIQNAKQDMEGY